MQQNGAEQAAQGPGFYLDPSAVAKQMAALSSAGRARRATQGGQPDDNQLEPNVPFATISSYQAPAAISNPMMQQQQAQLRARAQFYNTLASLMNMRGTPLPPSITGVQGPYDPMTSTWKTLELSSEPGGVRLSGRDIDLYRLFSTVMSAGGSPKISASNGWGRVALALDLPPEVPHPQSMGNLVEIGGVLSQYYQLLVKPVEDAWMRNVANKQQQAQSKAQAPLGTPPRPMMANAQTSGTAPPMSQEGFGQRFPLVIPSGSQNFPSSTPTTGPPGSAHGTESPQRLNSALSNTTGPRAFSVPQDDLSENDGKRRTDTSSDSDLGFIRRVGENGIDSSNVEASQPTRRKIEYIPVAREVETFGGRDLDAIEAELARNPSRRPMHSVDEWDQVDVEGLVMSLRSRLPLELSYSVTTLMILSTMRGQTPMSGFPLHHAEDLLDEVLDVLDEKASESTVTPTPAISPPSRRSNPTQRELMRIVAENESHLFVDVGHQSWSKLGPTLKPVHYVLFIISILRNFSVTQENQAFMGKMPRLLELLMRVTGLEEDVETKSLSPLAPALALSDVLQVRQDTLHILVNLAPHIDLSLQDSTSIQAIFHLICSFLVDRQDAVGPSAWCGSPATTNQGLPPQPPLSADLALDLLSKVAQPDNNRRALAQTISEHELWCLLEALVHRLPVSDADHKVANTHHWLSYIDRILFSMYCIAFIATPQLKKRIRLTRDLGFAMILLRMIRRYTMQTPAEQRQFYTMSIPRAIETLKLIDEGENSFDTPQMAMPAVAFGMGYGEQGNSKIEVGTGLLGGYQEDVTWGVMVNTMDSTMFSELESLSRVG